MAKALVLVFYLVITITTINAQKRARPTIPQLTHEVLKTGEVRVYIPDRSGIRKFEFHASLIKELQRHEKGDYFKQTTEKNGSFWILIFQIPVSQGSRIYYWMSIISNNFQLVTEGSWTVDELQDSYAPLRDPECQISATVTNGKASSCIGSVIFEDNVNGPTVDTSKWMVHHKIPTFSGPNFEFNSYLDQDDTRFFKNNKLYLKPIACTDEKDVRGVLNLTDKCTSSKPSECLYSQKFSYILPPTKSAKVTSHFSFKYGKIEVRAKLSSGDWLVPIIELEDKAQTEEENSPIIWVAYSRGNQVLKGNGPEDYGSRMLFAGPVFHPADPMRNKQLVSKYGQVPFCDAFHLYTLEWKPGKMIFSVDDEVFGEISTEDYSVDVRNTLTSPKEPYNREYVLSLGVAVGGVYDFPDGLNSGDNVKPWKNTDGKYLWSFFDARGVWMSTWHGDDVAMQVDYVKITAI